MTSLVSTFFGRFRFPDHHILDERVLDRYLSDLAGLEWSFGLGLDNTIAVENRVKQERILSRDVVQASVTPIIAPGDSRDVRISEAVVAQRKSRLPLLREFGWQQLWRP